MGVLGSILIAALSVAIDWERVGEPRDAELLRVIEAIENQIADLPIVLVAPEEAATASVAVTIAAIPAGYRVVIEARAAEQVIVREVQSARRDRRLRASALREGAALAIRGTLQALVAGEHVAAEAPAAVVDEPEPEPELPPPVVAAPVLEEPAALPFFGGVGWRVGAASSDFAIEQGITLRGGVVVAERFEAAAELSFGLPLILTDAQTKIALSRHRALASFAYRIYENRSLAVVTALAAGLTIARRSASALAPEVSTTPAKTRPEFLAALDARLRIGGTFALELAAGADLIPGAPILTYTRGGEKIERARLFILQPKLGLAIFFSTP